MAWGHSGRGRGAVAVVSRPTNTTQLRFNRWTCVTAADPVRRRGRGGGTVNQSFIDFAPSLFAVRCFCRHGSEKRVLSCHLQSEVSRRWIESVCRITDRLKGSGY